MEEEGREEAGGPKLIYHRRINRVSEDFSTFELEYKGKTYHTVSSASKEMYR